MNEISGKFAAIVLAGDRGPDDPLVKAAGVACKALLPVAGRPMILRVLDALDRAPVIGSCLVSGSSERLRGCLPEFEARIAAGKVQWVENEASPSLSARVALDRLPPGTPVLVTTADHALLTPGMVEHFCARAMESGCDVVAGLARAELVSAALPETRRTVTRLKDGAYCSCNLFGLLTPRASRAATFWRKIEEQRRHPLKMVRVLGVVAVLRYLLGLLSIRDGVDRLSALMDLRAGVVWMPDAEAAVDVDKMDDWTLVEKILARRGEA